MAEAINIILEYLRHHNFTKAEAALQSELLSRQEVNCSNPSVSRNDFDSNFSLHADSRRRDGIIYDKGAVLNVGELESVSASNKQSSRSGLLCKESKKLDLTGAGSRDVKFELVLDEKPLALGLEVKQLEHQSEKFLIQSGKHAIGESKKSGDEVVMKMGDIEPQQEYEKQRSLVRRWKAHKDDSNMRPLERIIGVQNDSEDKSFDICQNGAFSFGSRSQQELSEDHSRILENSREEKDRTKYQELPPREVGHDQQSMDMFCQASNVMLPKRWEDLEGLSLQEAGETSCKPDIGVPQFEKATIVHEGGEFSGRQLYPCDEKESLPRGLASLDWSENQCTSTMVNSYNTFTENGWLDHEQPRQHFSVSSGKAPPIKTRFPYLFSYPSNELFSAQLQNNERQVDWEEKVEGVNAKGKDTDIGQSIFLEQSTLPWEANSPNDGGTQGSFDDAKVTSEEGCEELPRLRHVRLRAMDKDSDWSRENNVGLNFESTSNMGPHHPMTGVISEPSFELGSYLDIPMGQDITSSGSKRPSGSSRLSISQGIVEDTPELLSGFASLRDGPDDSGIGYPHEFWESDNYEDDDDPGYHRQPIEDEAWFLAHEIDYPSDEDRTKSNMGGVGRHSQNMLEKREEDDRSFMEEESYFSGEQFYRLDKNESRAALGEGEGIGQPDFYEKTYENDIAGLSQIEGIAYDGELMDAEELKLMRAEPVWKGFVAQTSQLGQENIRQEFDILDKLDSLEVDDDKQGSIRSGGAGVRSDAADYGSEVRDSLLGGSSEGDYENLHVTEVIGYKTLQMSSGRENSTLSNKNFRQAINRSTVEDANEHDVSLRYHNESWDQCYRADNQIVESSFYGLAKGSDVHKCADLHEDEDGGLGFGGFCFPSPSSTGDMLCSRGDSGKSLPVAEDLDVYGSGMGGPDDTLASWKRKSNESSPILSPRDGALINAPSSFHSIISHSSDGYLSREVRKEREDAGNDRENGEPTVGEGETATVQEQIRQLKAEDNEHEIFNLRIIHRRNRTGFEEDKNLPVVINSVIAGRYHVTEYLGSAAFSKAIQAHDLHTGQDVCMKIIKNNKDFFDQSLDEIKLLKFINRHDPADKYHTLRLYDYFYYREHLFIVCELLRANLYEFHKFNRESGGEVYFTMPRLQSITRQCLEALEFLHNLGLIHCDLKPENILVKSYSRCEVKVIDFGSSCFQTDHLCPYVQSRSYRAPEVILGLPYNQKIDIWSLGCILAELCCGNVLFQNDSLATLLARVIGIIGPVGPEMLVKGRDTHKYFTKNHMLYERNPDTNQLEYLLPKKTSLGHRLPLGDQGFVDFVGYLLQINPENRPSATEALKHPWLSYPYEPISS